jgi:hypothetical protein
MHPPQQCDKLTAIGVAVGATFNSGIFQSPEKPGRGALGSDTVPRNGYGIVRIMYIMLNVMES